MGVCLECLLERSRPGHAFAVFYHVMRQSDLQIDALVQLIRLYSWNRLHVVTVEDQQA